ncbi:MULTISPECIES: MFS transporter [unclassified Olleya]|uniref:MFS transporter n=1 Tax=unclassified Olleya TaxID=2615019 RepID=UPI000C303A84|nr:MULTISPECIES: MFS transporter [unclassified Olleya]AUC75777.1 MFS transporter [Olleya sp. Bg11-27]QXP61644.1 MFS transporter [Olleya sp. HaHaR_3_96]
MQDQLKVFKIIHLALVVGLIVAYFFLGNISALSQLKLPTLDNASMIYIILPVAAFLISNLMFRLLVSKIDNTLSLKEKIVPYQSASIVRYAIIEGTAFFILIIKPDFIIFGILLIVYLALLMPTEQRIKRDLKHLD